MLGLRHPTNCACEAHSKQRLTGDRRLADEGAVSRWLGNLAPVLACAVCPACVTTYAKVFSLMGLGFALTETQHVALLTFAVLISLGLSGRRTWIERRAWPIVVSVLGCALLVLGHVLGEVHWLEWSGVAVLLVGGLAERQLARRSALRRQVLVPA